MNAEIEKKLLEGTVISAKMKDTIVVEVQWNERDSKYGKLLRRRSKVYVHDQGNRAKEGDRVRVRECRPISKTKTWTLMDVLDSRS